MTCEATGNESSEAFARAIGALLSDKGDEGDEDDEDESSDDEEGERHPSAAIFLDWAVRNHRQDIEAALAQHSLQGEPAQD